MDTALGERDKQLVTAETLSGGDVLMWTRAPCFQLYSSFGFKKKQDKQDHRINVIRATFQFTMNCFKILHITNGKSPNTADLSPENSSDEQPV